MKDTMFPLFSSSPIRLHRFIHLSFQSLLVVSLLFLFPNELHSVTSLILLFLSFHTWPYHAFFSTCSIPLLFVFILLLSSSFVTRPALVTPYHFQYSISEVRIFFVLFFITHISPGYVIMLWTVVDISLFNAFSHIFIPYPCFAVEFPIVCNENVNLIYKV